MSRAHALAKRLWIEPKLEVKSNYLYNFNQFEAGNILYAYIGYIVFGTIVKNATLFVSYGL